MKKKQKAQQSVNFKKNSFEINAWTNNSIVIGIDEVGRGCLAGPLVAAAVILPPDTKYYLLKDSKILSPEEREKAFKWIKKHCKYGIGIVHNRIIDKHNIWQTTLIAMKKALLNLTQASHIEPSAILIDAMPLDIKDTHLRDIPVHHFYYGEKKSSSIAAASIIAKVTRDSIMKSFNVIIPGYKLVDNKGYGTQAHKNALMQESHSIIHRMSFLKNILQQKDPVESQLSLDTLGFFTEGIDSHETKKILCRSD